MKIKECYIDNFGKLSDFKISFEDGLNTVKADNGYGKTTLSVFIKAMFYGLENTKRAKIAENERKHYLPWSGLSAGGSLSFTAGGKSYRIERRFMPKAQDDTFKLYDEDTGKESQDFSDAIGEELFGIDADGFERTVFLSEQNLSGKNENKTVSAKLSNLVGYECDLSAMDEALLLLENERKVYYKKGGSGEIGELKEKINSLKIRLSELKREEITLEEEKKRYNDIKAELSALTAERERLKALNAENIKKRERYSYEKQYLDMKISLEREIALREKEELFFKNGIPKSETIDSLKAKLAEAKRLRNVSLEAETGDFKALADFFKKAPRDEEFERIKHLSQTEKEKRKEAEILLAQTTHRTSEFSDFEAARAEIEALTEELNAFGGKRKRTFCWKPLLLLGAFTFLLGIGLSFVWTLLLILSGIGLGFIAFSLWARNASKKDSEMEKVACRVKKTLENKYSQRNITSENLLDTLYSLRAELISEEKEEARISAIYQRAAALKAEADEMQSELGAFLSHFELPKECDTGAAIDEILTKRAEFELLKRSYEERIVEKQKAKARADEYEADIKEFLSLYPTVTDDPFFEISEHLLEYNTRSISISRMEKALADFAENHCISPDNLLESIPNMPEEESLASINEQVTLLEKQAALAERTVNMISEECEAIPEYEAEIEELTEKKALYENKLSVIIKTKQYLTEAKDSLTAKYLSGTKSAFDTYVNMISSESGQEFNMDTSFAVMKNEGGSYKPVEAYSRGYKDLYAIAARFAIIDSLYTQESPFVILDDPFAYFDGEKLSNALSLIKALSEKKQIIYLTCSSERCI